MARLGVKCTFPLPYFAQVLVLAAPLLLADDKLAVPEAGTEDPVLTRIEAHETAHPSGEAAFSWDLNAYRNLKDSDLASLPIGVFDSGIGGLTVLQSLLTLDALDNASLQPGPDGKADLAGERFLYLGDQANMPYGNYPAKGREDYLRELILKDAIFLWGKRYHVSGENGVAEPRWDKPPVKAIVIACNTATAYGLGSVRELLRHWKLPLLVVGVVEAGAFGLEKTPGEGAIGVLATVGTCASEVYPKTIASTFQRAGRSQPIVTQWGSASLAGVIEGDPASPTPLKEQVAADVRALVEGYRNQSQALSGTSMPLQRIVLGCTHFPLVTNELDAAFESLRKRPDLAPWIAPHREFVNPSHWTARELLHELDQAHLRRAGKASSPETQAAFFISVPRSDCPGVKLAAPGALDVGYKYQRTAGRLDVEDTVVVPLTRSLLPETSRKLLQDRLPAVWKLLPAGDSQASP